MTTIVRNLMPMRPAIRANDLAPYGAALVTIGVLAIVATYGLRRVADRFPVASAAPSPSVEPAGAPAARPLAARSPTGRAPSTPSKRTQEDTQELIARHLTLPVANVRPEHLVPTFDEARGDRPHEAIDIMAPRGTPVMAVEDGRIARLFWSNAGGRTIYHFDPSETFTYYYAHLDSYVDGLTEGQWVRRGQVIGYVGSTGNASANAPHLHFAIFQLTSAKRWWDGEAIDPYPILRGSVENDGTP